MAELKEKPKFTKAGKPIFREGDLVRVINPVFVVRAGLPKTTQDYLPKVEEVFGALLKKHLGDDELDSPLRMKLARELGWKDHFGGHTRKLYTIEYPDLVGEVLKVVRVVTRWTGKGYSSSGYTNYDGEYDYESGGLENAKAHRLVIGSRFQLSLSHEFYLQENTEHRDGLGDLTIETLNLEFATDCTKKVTNG